MSLPNEIWKEIICFNSLKDARLINKEICFMAHKEFIQCMHVITKEHRLSYYEEGNSMGFYDREMYMVNKKGIIYEYGPYEGPYIVYINIRKLLYNTPIDFISTYQILKCRDIYKENFAKEHTLKLLQRGKLSLYTSSYEEIIKYRLWLCVNLCIVGILEFFEYDHQRANLLHYKEENVKLYKMLEDYIKI